VREARARYGVISDLAVDRVERVVCVLPRVRALDLIDAFLVDLRLPTVLEVALAAPLWIPPAMAPPTP
jgi:hypothetical protein